MNSCKNGIFKTALSLPKGRILNNMTIVLPLMSNWTGSVSKYIIPSLYNIGSPKIVINGYRSCFYLCGNFIFIIAAGDI